MKLLRKTAHGLSYLEVPGDPGAPTIVLLHGYGAGAEDLVDFSQLGAFPVRPTWLFPEGPLKVPIAPGITGKAWFDVDVQKIQQAATAHDLSAVQGAFSHPALIRARMLVEGWIGELHIPRSQLVLGGFSQGAILAVDTALHGSDPCAGLLIFSGTLIEEANWRAEAAHHMATPFFQSHGTLDTLLPFALAHKLEHLLKEARLPGRLHPFEGGHTFPPTLLKPLHLFLSNLLC